MYASQVWENSGLEVEIIGVGNQYIMFVRVHEIIIYCVGQLNDNVIEVIIIMYQYYMCLYMYIELIHVWVCICRWACL